MWFNFPMFGEVFLVTLYWFLALFHEEPRLRLFGLFCKYCRLADKQQKVVSCRPGGWGVPRSPAGATPGEACFLVPRLPAASPCPRSMGAYSLLAWPLPECLPPRIITTCGVKFEGTLIVSPLQSVSIPCIISVLWNNLSFPNGPIYILFVICSWALENNMLSVEMQCSVCIS